MCEGFEARKTYTLPRHTRTKPQHPPLDVGALAALIGNVSWPGGRCRALRRYGQRDPVEESPGSMEAKWRLTAAGGDPRESATENKPPNAAQVAGSKGETVR